MINLQNEIERGTLMDIKELEKIITDCNQTDECVVANDNDVLEISNKLLAQNKEAYEVLAK